MAGHAETKIPPEPGVFLDHLQRKEVKVLESLRVSAQHTLEREHASVDLYS